MGTAEIGLVGGSGRVGSRLAALLAGRDVPLRLIMRKPGPQGSPGAEIVLGDLDRPDSLLPAFSGLHTLILITADSPSQADRGIAAIAAARAAGIRYLIILSAMLAGERRPRAFAAAHARIEAAAIASGIPCQIIRPSFFMQSFFLMKDDIAAGRMILPGRTARIAFIDAADVAECVAHCALLRGPPADRPLVLTGSRALRFAEVANLIGIRTGRRVRHVPLPIWLGRLVLPVKLGWFTGRSMAYLFACLEAGKEADPTGDVHLLLNRAPTSFEDFLDREGGGFRPYSPA